MDVRDPSFAPPAHQLAGLGLDPPQVARAPSGGQGLALTETGAIPSSLIPASNLTGRIASAGTVTAGTGFTVNRSGTGTYDVTFTTAFTAAPTVLANPVAGASNLTATITNVATTGVTINTHTGTGSATNTDFHFVAFATV